VPGADPTARDTTVVLARALAAGQDTLLEAEGYALLEALGIATPAWCLVPDAAAASAGRERLGDRVVVKVASRAIVHKTDVGGVAVVPNDAAAVGSAVAAMAERLAGLPVDGFLLSAFVDHEDDLGAELLVALRRTDDFGPVVTVGAGGVRAELLAGSLRPGQDVAVFDTDTPDARIAERLLALPVTRIACGAARGTRALVAVEVLVRLVRRLLAFGDSAAGRAVAELEMNPLALVDGRPVALDVLVRLDPDPPTPAPPRPLAKLAALLRPRSMAIVGVSEDMNAGRLILRNVLHEGFPADRVRVVKAGTTRLDGVLCVPSLADLPEPADLCVLAVAAPAVPGLMDEIIAGRRAESVIVIPGGLGEREGSGTLESRIRASLVAARATPWGGPAVNGGNCLGVRSVPGRYDTTFIPPHKIGGPSGGPVAPVALLAQSGAFAVARWSRLGGASPRYLVSVGNQTDLTLGDYLTHLAGDPDVAVFACYVEGFRPGDGRQWLAAARAIVASGRTVLLYRAGRTPAGRAAGASHTAAIAGDYVVTRELAGAAGVLVADTLDEFDDLLRLTTLLADRRPTGPAVGAVSNAGFECVALADGVGTLRLAPLGQDTRTALASVLERHRLAGVVDVQHPLDLTPMMDDDGVAECVGVLLADPAVDVGVVGLVPLTGALQTLPAGAGHAERLDAPDGVVARLAAVRRGQGKPFVVVVDAGAAYDPLAAALETAGMPAFRTMDRAMRALARLVRGDTPAARPRSVPAAAGAVP
jgi:acyl-CoA synthetase (NDP forming)